MANANAPGQRFDRATAMEYSGRDFEDTHVVHAGIVDNAVKRHTNAIRILEEAVKNITCHSSFRHEWL